MKKQLLTAACLLSAVFYVKGHRLSPGQSAASQNLPRLLRTIRHPPVEGPAGMHMEIFHYNVNVGGTYRLALCYDDKKAKGKPVTTATL
jgi:hypothetical protein